MPEGKPYLCSEYMLVVKDGIIYRNSDLGLGMEEFICPKWSRGICDYCKAGKAVVAREGSGEVEDLLE